MNTKLYDFKAGDYIRMSESCSGAKEGKIYKLVNFQGSLLANVSKNKNEGCMCHKKWEFIARTPREVKMVLLKA